MKANVQKKKITGNGFLLLITIALFSNVCCRYDCFC